MDNVILAAESLLIFSFPIVFSSPVGLDPKYVVSDRTSNMVTFAAH